jgi:hypothetical protein
VYQGDCNALVNRDRASAKYDKRVDATFFNNWRFEVTKTQLESSSMRNNARLQPGIRWKDSKAAGCSVELGAQIYAIKSGGVTRRWSKRVDAFVTWGFYT